VTVGEDGQIGTNRFGVKHVMGMAWRERHGGGA
jgi:hypothetical protein